MNRYARIILSIFSVWFVLMPIKAQTKRHVKLRWTNAGDIPDTLAAKDITPFFPEEHLDWDGKTLYYVENLAGISVDTASLRISRLRYAPVSPALAEKFCLQNRPEKFEGHLTVLHGKSGVITVFRINTLAYINGSWQKLESFDWEFRSVSVRYRPHTRSVPVIGHSPWATGDWYRIETPESGIYKIDKAFLQSLGINVSRIDPRHIRIFGWGGQMLPLTNNSGFPQSIAEIAIEVRGESDGSFDDGDYILFYGRGLKGWNREYGTHNNLYTNHAYYYLQISDTRGKRITDAAVPTGNPVWSKNEYLASQFYETDSVNIVKLGREWYGNNFNFGQAVRTFDFDFRDRIVSRKIRFRVKLATDNPLQGRITIEANGIQAAAYNMPALSPVLQQNGIQAVKYIYTDSIQVPDENIHIRMVYDDNGYAAAKIFLDYIRVEAFCRLDVNGRSFAFSHPAQTNATEPVEYRLNNTDGLLAVWDITDPFNIKRYAANQSHSFTFKAPGGKHLYHTVTEDFKTPEIPEHSKVANSDLNWDTFYGSGRFVYPEYLLIAPGKYEEPSMRLVEFHRQNGITAYFAPLEEIYKHFGNGTQDIAAIRNYIRYVYMHAPAGESLRYVTFLGDASWDYKNLQITAEENTNIVPIYQSSESFSLVSSFATDDFFVSMDDNEGDLDNTQNIIDIAIGRIPASSLQEANALVDKILHYYDPSTFGHWHNSVTLVSDDADGPSHTWELGLITTSMAIARDIETYHPFINLKKIYLDAYPEEATSGGFRYPAAKRELLNAFEKGMLILNFIGHGNEYGWTHERIMNIPEIKSLRNYDKLPFVSTVTCEFGRFDNPETVSGGELFVLNRHGGAFQIITTTREISAASGMYMNKTLYRYLLGIDSGHFTHFRTPGEALMLAKQRYISLNKKVSLLGDPAMALHFPNPQIVITSVNGHGSDTLRALDHIRLEGEVRNASGQLLQNFNGTLSTVIFDKKKYLTTLNNDNVPGQNFTFSVLGASVFRGKTYVRSGRFNLEFIVPKDIRTQYGNGRISLYASENESLYKGVDTLIVIGGVNNSAPEDHTPPEIKLFMNDENFNDGDITGTNPFLLVKLADENGINTVGGVGHDIVAIIDENENEAVILNDFYEAESGTYQRGKIKYKYFDLEPGLHTVKVKAWDTYNNLAEAKLRFRVVEKQKLEIKHVLNYPNPFIDYTEFWFNHNRPYETLDVRVEVFSASGVLVWQTRNHVMTEGYLSREITWNGRDRFGQKIGKGVYFYRITVRTSDGKEVSKWEKLVKL